MYPGNWGWQRNMLVFWDEKACLSSRSKWVTGRQSSINKSICALQCLLPFPPAESGEWTLAAQGCARERALLTFIRAKSCWHRGPGRLRGALLHLLLALLEGEGTGDQACHHTQPVLCRMTGTELRFSPSLCVCSCSLVPFRRIWLNLFKQHLSLGNSSWGGAKVSASPIFRLLSCLWQAFLYHSYSYTAESFKNYVYSCVLPPCIIVCRHM